MYRLKTKDILFDIGIAITINGKGYKFAPFCIFKKLKHNLTFVVFVKDD